VAELLPLHADRHTRFEGARRSLPAGRVQIRTPAHIRGCIDK